MRKHLLALTLFITVSACALPPQATPTPSPILAAPAQASSSPTASPVPASPPSTTAETLAAGWQQIFPGGETLCARGGEYSFFVRKSATPQAPLLIYFEGGGGCYDAESCRPGSQSWDDSIDAAVQADNPALKRDGVFALDDGRNPFANYDIVFVSYCTGDGFLGNKTVTYDLQGQNFDIHHVGFTNTQSVLNWTFKHFPKPPSVFVIGCSAGVVGSAFHAPYIQRQYADLPLTVVGDSGAGYRDAPATVLERLGMFDLLPDWLPAYRSFTPADFHTAALFTIPALSRPQDTFALVDSRQDSAQKAILDQLGGGLSLTEVIDTNLDELQAAAPNIRAFTGPGDHHCITMRPEYYEYSSAGTLLNDWMTALAAGVPVQDVRP